MTTRKLPSEILDERPELEETKIGIWRGVIGIIPYVGPIINETLFDINSRISQRRINELVEYLKIEFEKLKADSINQDYLQSDDFFDFTRSIFENAIKIASLQKKRILASIYKDSVQKCAKFDSDNLKLFLDFAVSLTDVQILILKFIEQCDNLSRDLTSFEESYMSFINQNKTLLLSKDEFRYYCNDLESKCLLNFQGLLSNEVANLISFEDSPKAKIIITDLGFQFINYLTND